MSDKLEFDGIKIPVDMVREKLEEYDNQKTHKERTFIGRANARMEAFDIDYCFGLCGLRADVENGLQIWDIDELRELSTWLVGLADDLEKATRSED